MAAAAAEMVISLRLALAVQAAALVAAVLPRMVTMDRQTLVAAEAAVAEIMV